MLHAIYRVIPFKKNLFDLIKLVYKPSKSVYQHLHFHGDIKVKVGKSNAFKIRHYGYQIENDLYWAGYGNGFESTSLNLWALLSKDCKTVFDIGANTGIYALAASAMNPDAKVYAFEPIHRIADKLAHNVEMNGYDIEVVVAGASYESKQTEIYETATEHAYSASLSPDMLVGVDNVISSKIDVIRVDDFVNTQAITKIDLVKVDAEKFEAEVLEGFGDLIKRDKPAFLMEVLNEQLGQDVSKFFVDMGYTFFRIEDGIGVFPTETLGTKPLNYLICTSDVIERFGFEGSRLHADLLP